MPALSSFARAVRNSSSLGWLITMYSPRDISICWLCKTIGRQQNLQLRHHVVERERVIAEGADADRQRR